MIKNTKCIYRCNVNLNKTPQPAAKDHQLEQQCPVMITATRENWTCAYKKDKQTNTLKRFIIIIITSSKPIILSQSYRTLKIAYILWLACCPYNTRKLWC